MSWPCDPGVWRNLVHLHKVACMADPVRVPYPLTVHDNRETLSAVVTDGAGLIVLVRLLIGDSGPERHVAVDPEVFHAAAVEGLELMHEADYQAAAGFDGNALKLQVGSKRWSVPAIADEVTSPIGLAYNWSRQPAALGSSQFAHRHVAFLEEFLDWSGHVTALLVPQSDLHGAAIYMSDGCTVVVKPQPRREADHDKIDHFGSPQGTGR